MPHCLTFTTTIAVVVHIFGICLYNVCLPWQLKDGIIVTATTHEHMYRFMHSSISKNVGLYIIFDKQLFNKITIKL